MKGQWGNIPTIFTLSSLIYLICRLFLDQSWTASAAHFVIDVVCLPWLLSITNWMLLILYPSKAPLMKWDKVLFAVLITSVLFEWILPGQSSTYTSDWLDVLAYAIGGLVFMLLKQEPDSNLVSGVQG